MTGWSGDGAPGTGSLREFAIGAVTQHFTKRLERVAGPRLQAAERASAGCHGSVSAVARPRDATSTWPRSRSRTRTSTPARRSSSTAPADPAAGGTCNFCHTNGGALSANRQNRNFNTNVEDVVASGAQPSRTFRRTAASGRTANPDGTFGNRTFNTASVVEAADTAPFFHNNVVNTLEGVVEFYSGPEFNDPTAPGDADSTSTPTQDDQIADFMRGLNTLQNIDVARRELEEILANRSDPRGEQDTRLQTAFEETEDAIDVLKQGGIFPAGVTQLTSARTMVVQAQRATTAAQRRLLISQAIVKLTQARNAFATVAP